MDLHEERGLLVTQQLLSGYAEPVSKPIGALEGHLIYDFKKRGLWTSLDGNFWLGGGATTIGGIENSLTRQVSSRLGATVAVPISKHQAIKMSYSDGTYNRYGGNSQSVSVAWQYSWLGQPK